MCPACGADLGPNGPFDSIVAEARFCPNCGGSLSACIEKPPPLSHGVASKTVDSEEFHVTVSPQKLSLAESPVRAEVRLRSPLRASAQGLIDVRLSSLTTARIRVSCVFSSSLTPNVCWDLDLAPHEHIERAIPCLPDCEGMHSLTVRLEFSDAEMPVFEGFTSFEVASATPAAPQVIYHDRRIIKGRIIVGTEGGTLNMSSIEQGALTSSGANNDFTQIDLYPLRQYVASARKTIADGYEEYLFPCDRVSLRVTDGETSRIVCLLAKRRVCLGRNANLNDIALQIGPRSAENEERSSQISRSHARVEFQPRGVIWKNLECIGGTSVDRVLLPPEKSCLIADGAEIEPGGVLKLKATLVRYNCMLDGGAYGTFARRHLHESTIPDPVGSVQAIRLERLNNLAGQEEYVFFQRGIAVGRDITCAIRLAGSDIWSIQACVFSLGGMLWLEACQSGNTYVDGKALALHCLVPLRPGIQMRLAGTQIDVVPFQQPSIQSSSEASF